MGIPSYFIHLINEYPDIIKNNLEKKIARLFLDMNCCIHPCSKKINDLYYGKIDNNSLENKIIDETISYLHLLIKHTNVNELIYISIDGVAPLAKISQQRLRRFKSIKEKKTLNNLRSEFGLNIIESWDSNAITPGTDFMLKLSKKLKNDISENDIYNNKIVILSDSSVPGEGEHKILQYIRNNSINDNEDIDVIYGLDADLIMLALSTDSNNIALLRENIHFNNKIENNIINNSEDSSDELNIFLYLDIFNLRNNLFEDLYLKINVEKEKYNIDKNNFIRDYIFICIFLGNDFLPHLPSLSIKSGSIQYLIDIYIKIYINLNDYLVKKNEINYIFLEYLFKEISSTEDDKLKMINSKRENFKINYIDENKNSYENKLIEHNYYPIISRNLEDIIDMGNEDWREKYYTNCFNYNSGKEFEIKKICHNYIQGLHWNLLYYFDKCPSWRWSYNYRNAPAAYDIYNYIKNNTYIKENNFDFNDKAYKPFETLMFVLPYESRQLLPVSLRKLLTNIDTGISQYYPIDFQLDTLNKKFYWECIPILPDINPDKIIKELSKCDILNIEKERNINGTDLKFIKKNKFSKSFIL